MEQWIEIRRRVLNGELSKRAACAQRGREVSQLNLQYFGEELIVPSGALPLSFQAVRGGMML
jgi:hypothetical protein